MPSKKLALEWVRKRPASLGDTDHYVARVPANRLSSPYGTRGPNWHFSVWAEDGPNLFAWGGSENIKEDDCIAVERALRDHLKPYAELYNKLVAVHGEGGE